MTIEQMREEAARQLKLTYECGVGEITSQLMLLELIAAELAILVNSQSHAVRSNERS